MPPTLDATTASAYARAGLSTLRTYQTGDVLIAQDAASSELFVIVDGSVDVTSEDELLANLGPGSVLGESSILDWWMPPKGERSKYGPDDAPRP